MELHFKYLKQVREVDDELGQEQKSPKMDEEDRYLRRLDSRLFILQQVDYIITELCLSSVGTIRKRLVTILGQRGESLETVKSVMEEYVQEMEEGNDSVAQEKQRLRSMIDEL